VNLIFWDEPFDEQMIQHLYRPDKIAEWIGFIPGNVCKSTILSASSFVLRELFAVKNVHRDYDEEKKISAGSLRLSPTRRILMVSSCVSPRTGFDRSKKPDGFFSSLIPDGIRHVEET
jgi:hypothetical protein